MPFDHFGMPDPAYGQPLTIKEMAQDAGTSIATVALVAAACWWASPLFLAITRWIDV